MVCPPIDASDYLFSTFSLIPLYYLSLDLRLLITSFGTFSLIPLYCLSLDLWLLITSLILFFNTIALSVPRFTASYYLFVLFLLYHCIVFPRFTASHYLFGTFSLIQLYCMSHNLRLLIISLVLFL
jgi:hypothetical protein